ncbi:hypothetical protein IF1G_03103 [Cordyceps javanica]|uniref:Uncharacterized protein n=1 Tax=Cordyceps javanica TaxID=43265 RepID=A0A545VBE6_9HYPO|nr:hypothetical protein IF1G_03103 [Cordyceps javanica]
MVWLSSVVGASMSLNSRYRNFTAASRRGGEASKPMTRGVEGGGHGGRIRCLRPPFRATN